MTRLHRTTLLEAGFPWQELRDIARREGTVKPAIYSMHRWWARRSPTLFRFILAASALAPGQADQLGNAASRTDLLSDSVVLDPFVGGGTSLVEATRLGAKVVGYDIEPLAGWITESELASFGSTVDWEPLDEVIEAARSEFSKYYPAPTGWQVLHYFWVARISCNSCHRSFDGHPSAVLARDLGRGYMVGICRYCSRLHRVDPDRRRIDCECGGRTTLDGRTAGLGAVACPHCGFEERLTDTTSRAGRIPFRLFAKELISKHDPNHRRFANATRTDHRAYDSAAAALDLERDLSIPNGAIPPGRHDGRPQIFGVTSWRQMFNCRQLLHHATVRGQFRRLPDPVRRYAQLAFSESLATNCMFCFYSTDYRRIAAAFSIHGYMSVARPVELNPWVDGSGRGTLLNCIKKVRRGVDSVGSLSPAKQHIYVRSSEHMRELKDASVDLILTDPPFYHDNLEYDRLAGFYSSWGDEILKPSTGSPLQLSNGEGEFARRLADILRECSRVLKRDGIIAFTFAHARASGWNALDEALSSCGLSLTAAIPVEAEGSNGFHSHPGNLKWNGLFVCRKGRPEMEFDPAPLREAMDDIALSDADRVNLARALAVARKHASKARGANGR
jgi:putative DNA methylase